MIPGIDRDERTPVAAHPFDILAIVFVTLWLATASVAFAYYTKWNAADLKWKQATVDAQNRAEFKAEQRTVVDLQEENAKLSNDLFKLSHVTGFYLGDEAVTNLEALAKTLNDLGAEFKLGMTEIDYRDPVKQNNILTVNSAVTRLEARISDLLGNDTDGVNKLEAKQAELQGAIKKDEGGQLSSARAKEAEALKKLNEELDEVRKKVEAKRKANISLRRTLVMQRDSERKKVESALALKHKLDTKLFRTNEKYKSKIAELKKTFDNITKGLKSLEEQVRIFTNNVIRKDQKQPDGEIYSSSSDNDTCYVDLNRKDRLLRGMLFEVFRYKKGGKEVPRGLVQIIQVGEKMSKARIVERVYNGRTYKMADRRDLPDHVLREFKIDPLGGGDMIRNRLYDKTKKRVFVIAGKLTSSYKNEEAKRLIEELGDEVMPNISERTDFIVLGLGYEKDKNYLKAKELGIPKMSERELLMVLGKY